MLAVLGLPILVLPGLIRFDLFARRERLLIGFEDIPQACARRLICLVRSCFLREELDDAVSAGARERIAERLVGGIRVLAIEDGDRLEDSLPLIL